MEPIKAYSVEVPDSAYWKRMIECQDGCPIHTDARGYVRAVAAGNPELAYFIARGPNPLASICGKACAAPCEKACRRGDLDDAIAIRAIKGYVCQRYGPEVRPDGGNSLIAYLKACAETFPLDNAGREELLPLLQAMLKGDIEPASGLSIGVIGAGPAGLAAAHDLALLGFDVTIYEMEPVLGGMLAVGIPEFRLPRNVIKAETDVIEGMGVKVLTNCCVGKDISFSELRETHAAIVLAVGAKHSRPLDVPGGDADGVIGGVELLREVCLGRMPKLGGKAVIVGGGDSAMDAARTAMRIHTIASGDHEGEHYLPMDAARAATRLGATEVHVAYRRSREEMPANRAEQEEAMDEGVQFHFLASPAKVATDDRGHVKGLWCHTMTLGEMDDSGRRRPVVDEGKDFMLDCDNILVATGQAFDLSFFDLDQEGLKPNAWGAVACDEVSGRTDAPRIYSSGDLATGPKTLIHAIASGKAVARSVYEDLTGRTIEEEDTELHIPLPAFDMIRDYEKWPREYPVMEEPGRRITTVVDPVEIGFTEDDAVTEAERCFDCGINTIFSGQKCIVCSGCVDVCPERCLRIVSLDSLQGGTELHDTVSTVLDGHAPEDACAIIKDETVCIRCGLCAVRCPTGAITMEKYCFREQLK